MILLNSTNYDQVKSLTSNARNITWENACPHATLRSLVGLQTTESSCLIADFVGYIWLSGANFSSLGEYLAFGHISFICIIYYVWVNNELTCCYVTITIFFYV